MTLMTIGVTMTTIGVYFAIFNKVLGIVKERDDTNRKNDLLEYEIKLLKFKIEFLQTTKS